MIKLVRIFMVFNCWCLSSGEKRPKRIIDGAILRERLVPGYEATKWFVWIGEGIVALHLSQKWDWNNEYCGGVLLTPKVVQSACTCNTRDWLGRKDGDWVYPKWDGVNVDIVVGESEVEVDTEVKTIPITKWAFHPLCRITRGKEFYWVSHDYMLLGPEDEIPIDGEKVHLAPVYRIQSIAESWYRAHTKNTVCLTIGMGQYSEGSNGRSKVIRQSWRSVESYDKCKDYFTEDAKTEYNLTEYQTVNTWSCLEVFDYKKPSDYSSQIGLAGDGDWGSPVSCDNFFFGLLNKRFVTTIVFNAYHNAFEFRAAMIQAFEEYFITIPTKWQPTLKHYPFELKPDDIAPRPFIPDPVCSTELDLEGYILPNDPRARRMFVESGCLARIQAIQAEPGSTLMELINIVNHCFPEEIIRYYSPGYPETFVEAVENYKPTVPAMFAKEHDEAEDSEIFEALKPPLKSEYEVFTVDTLSDDLGHPLASLSTGHRLNCMSIAVTKSMSSLRNAVAYIVINSSYQVTEKIPENPEPERAEAVAPRYQEFLGNLYAGQSEFPWIVDVKVPNLEQLDAVGNLLTAYNVLITCRTLVNYEKYLPVGDVAVTYYEGAASLRITFASMYLREIERSPMLYKTPDSEKKLAGLRLASWLLKHPNCNKGKNYAADFALIGLNRPVDTLPPYVLYAPIYHTRGVANQIPDSTEWTALTTEKICWVGAWGRNYTNVRNAMTYEHKVKIRAYAYPDFQKCLDIWSMLCQENSLADADICKDNTPPQKPPGLICMYTRARVGAVCDTNKGAPVVCDGQIFGLVTRAVPPNKCSSIEPKPFVVENMHRIEEGNPPLYSGQLLTRNRQGAAPPNDDDNLIIYVRNGCSKMTSTIALPSVVVCFLMKLSLG